MELKEQLIMVIFHQMTTGRSISEPSMPPGALFNEPAPLCLENAILLTCNSVAAQTPVQVSSTLSWVSSLKWAVSKTFLSIREWVTSRIFQRYFKSVTV